MAPVQRDGIEYEFTVTAELDYEHNVIVDKTRCHLLSGRMFPGPKADEMARLLSGWLNDGEPPADRATVEKLVARMAALADDPRKACKAAFLAAFGRPEQLLARSISEASDLIGRFEGPTIPPAAPAGTTPNQGDGDDGATTEGMPGQAAAASPGEVPAQTMPAGDAPEPDPAHDVGSAGDQAAAAAPPAPDTVDFADRVNALPIDLAQSVRSAEREIIARGVVPKSQQHVDEARALLEDAEKAQAKRAQQVAIALNAGAKAAGWPKAITDDQRHQLILAFSDGAVASARRVTAEQLRTIKARVREWENGSIAVTAEDGGTFAVHHAAVAS
jgi:hypothetical protein